MDTNQAGFTLVELLVTITIIGLLAAITVTNFNGANAKARDAQRKNDLKVVREALEQYKQDQISQSYPIQTGTPSNTLYNSMTTTLGSGTYLRSPYPLDPRNTATGGHQYRYQSDGTTYTLETCLERSDDQQQTSTASPCSASKPMYQVTNP